MTTEPIITVINTGRSRVRTDPSDLAQFTAEDVRAALDDIDVEIELHEQGEGPTSCEITVATGDRAADRGTMETALRALGEAGFCLHHSSYSAVHPASRCIASAIDDRKAMIARKA